MKKYFKYILLISCCLSILLLAFGPTPRSHAASLVPTRPLSGSCMVTTPEDTGISYDASVYSTMNIAGANQPMGMFSFTGSDAPTIGGTVCSGTENEFYLDVTPAGARWYNVKTTINGITTETTPGGSYVIPVNNFIEIQVTASPDQQASYQVQACYSKGLIGSFCSSWSPTLWVTMAANAYCQNGYVWRQAAPFDLVCVTSEQRSQVAYDNSQVASRIDPAGAYGPQSCVSGYVWRQAFGGDDVCVTPSERSQAAYDNSQAIARIVAL